MADLSAVPILQRQEQRASFFPKGDQRIHSQVLGAMAALEDVRQACGGICIGNRLERPAAKVYAGGVF